MSTGRENFSAADLAPPVVEIPVHANKRWGVLQIDNSSRDIPIFCELCQGRGLLAENPVGHVVTRISHRGACPLVLDYLCEVAP